LIFAEKRTKSAKLNLIMAAPTTASVLLRAVPKWLITLIFGILTIILLYAVFFASAPIYIFDKRFGRSDAVLSLTIPIGSITAYGGAVETPGQIGDLKEQGWLLCDGQALKTSDQKFQVLYRAIGDYWTTRRNAGEFQVPDLRGQFLRGLDREASVDPDGRTRSVGSRQADAFKVHSHTNSTTAVAGNHAHGIGTGDNDTQNGMAHRANRPNGGTSTAAAGDHQHSLIITPEGGEETRPKNAAVHYLIRFK
jgi:microcystin-dependent protein